MQNLTARARKLRREQTTPERKFWALLHPWRVGGLHFRRQCPMGPYIVDFACKPRDLVIEIDGDTHASDEAQARDTARSDYLASIGYRVIRFANRDVLENPEGVVEILTLVLGEPAAPT